MFQGGRRTLEDWRSGHIKFDGCGGINRMKVVLEVVAAEELLVEPIVLLEERVLMCRRGWAMIRMHVILLVILCFGGVSYSPQNVPLNCA
jgi:hypothetical protein